MRAWLKVNVVAIAGNAWCSSSNESDQWYYPQIM